MHQAVSNVADFRALDEAEILIGYMDGVSGVSLAEGVTRSYWHGWRNGLVDAGLIEPDEAYLQLEEEFSAIAIAGNA